MVRKALELLKNLAKEKADDDDDEDEDGEKKEKKEDDDDDSDYEKFYSEFGKSFVGSYTLSSVRLL